MQVRKKQQENKQTNRNEWTTAGEVDKIAQM